GGGGERGGRGGVANEVDLPDREVMGRPPVGVKGLCLGTGERAGLSHRRYRVTFASHRPLFLLRARPGLGRGSRTRLPLQQPSNPAGPDLYKVDEGRLADLDVVISDL